MEISLNKTRLIEEYLDDRLSGEARARFDIELAHDRKLKMNLFLQKQIRVLLRLYRRKKIKAELEVVHHDLFSDPKHYDFQQTIIEIFKR